MRLACPAGCGDTLPIASTAQTFLSPGGRTARYVAGRCLACGSQTLLDPSERAVAAMAARLAAEQAQLDVIRDSPPPRPDEAYFDQPGGKPPARPVKIRFDRRST